MAHPYAFHTPLKGPHLKIGYFFVCLCIFCLCFSIWPLSHATPSISGSLKFVVCVGVMDVQFECGGRPFALSKHTFPDCYNTFHAAACHSSGLGRHIPIRYFVALMYGHLHCMCLCVNLSPLPFSRVDTKMSQSAKMFTFFPEICLRVSDYQISPMLRCFWHVLLLMTFLCWLRLNPLQALRLMAPPFIVLHSIIL